MSFSSSDLQYYCFICLCPPITPQNRVVWEKKSTAQTPPKWMVKSYGIINISYARDNISIIHSETYLRWKTIWQILWIKHSPYSRHGLNNTTAISPFANSRIHRGAVGAFVLARAYPQRQWGKRDNIIAFESATRRAGNGAQNPIECITNGCCCKCQYRDGGLGRARGLVNQDHTGYIIHQSPDQNKGSLSALSEVNWRHEGKGPWHQMKSSWHMAMGSR